LRGLAALRVWATITRTAFGFRRLPGRSAIRPDVIWPGPDLDASFALLAEDLSLEPVELLFEPGDFRLQRLTQGEHL
jgi:hypothetical protein